MTIQHRNISRLLSIFAIASIALFSLLWPAGYFIISYQHLAGHLDAEAEINAGLISGIIRNNPELWKYEQERLNDLLNLRPRKVREESRRIYDSGNRIVCESTAHLDSPEIKSSFNLIESGRIVGRVEISRSLRPIILRTLIVALVALPLGVSLYLILHLIPLRKIRAAEESLKNTGEFLKKVMESTTNAIAVFNEKGDILHANPRFSGMIGSSDALVSKWNISSLFADEQYEEFRIRLDDIFQGKAETAHFDTEITTPSGDLILATCGAAPLILEGGISGVVVSFEDVTERKKMEDTVTHLAYHDFLTELPNRLLFINYLDIAISMAKRNENLLAVLFLDLDHLKNINDSLGHNAGDLLIKDIAARFRTCLRSSDTIARFGGDEFTILVPNISHPQDAVKTSMKLMTSLEAPFVIDGHRVHATVSIGISTFPEDGGSSEILLKNADIAMYHAKDQGRNNFQFYNTGMNVMTVEKIMLENSLRQSIKEGGLILYYQPQFSIASGLVSGVEALVRWQHPKMGFLDPSHFIKMAEETGLIVQLDEWVLREACTQIKIWRDMGLTGLKVSVNLSARHFQYYNLVETVAGVVRDVGVPASVLELEISENTVMQHIENTLPKLRHLQSMGVAFAIDDFGTGHTSLSYLKKLPISKLKIDKSYIDGFSSDPDYISIIEAVVAMAHSLKIKVVAEGVETSEQMKFLEACGCDEVQGYLLGKPLSAEALPALVSEAAAKRDSLRASVRPE